MLVDLDDEGTVGCDLRPGLVNLVLPRLRYGVVRLRRTARQTRYGFDICEAIHKSSVYSCLSF